MMRQGRAPAVAYNSKEAAFPLQSGERRFIIRSGGHSQHPRNAPGKQRPRHRAQRAFLAKDSRVRICMYFHDRTNRLIVRFRLSHRSDSRAFIHRCRAAAHICARVNAGPHGIR